MAGDQPDQPGSARHSHLGEITISWSTVRRKSHAPFVRVAQIEVGRAIDKGVLDEPCPRLRWRRLRPARRSGPVDPGRGTSPRGPQPPRVPAPRRPARRGIARRLRALGCPAPPGRGGARTRRARRTRRHGYSWLAGDHHIHTQYSSDGMYRVVDQVQHAPAYGLDWMVITDHGSVAHAKIGVEKVNPDIVAAREAARGHPGLPGPGVEHPGRRARHRVRAPRPQRGRGAQGVRERLRRHGQRHRRPAPRPTRRWPSPGLELPRRRRAGAGASRTRCSWPTTRPASGIDSPHEIRGWRDAAPGIARRHGGRARSPGRRHPAAERPRARAAASTTTARRRRLASRLPARELPHLGRLRLDDRDRRRALGQPARRGQAVVDHRELRLAHDLPGRPVGRGPGQRLRRQRALRRPGHGGTVRTTATATSGPATTAAPTSAPTTFSYAGGHGRPARRPRLGRPRRPDRRARRAGPRGRRPSPRRRHPARRHVCASSKGTAVELVITIDLADAPNWAQFVPDAGPGRRHPRRR